MFHHNIRPYIIKISWFEIRYYSLMYVLGFFISLYLIPKLAKRRNINLDYEKTLNMIIIFYIFMIIFARLFYVLYYGFNYYITHPMEILKIWHGGMSFHGGLIGLIIAGVIISKKYKIKFYDLADFVTIPAALSLFFGRIGNFINGELYGRVTNVPWAFYFPLAPDKGTLPRHPSQLYEAAKNLAIFFFLFTHYKKYGNKVNKKGYYFWHFMFLYGLLRFIIEFFREPEIEFNLIITLTAGQVLCLIMMIVSLPFVLSYYYKKKYKKKT